MRALVAERPSVPGFGEIGSDMTHDARTHDVVFTRRDGSVRKFRIYGRPMPGKGDVITLPVDGQLIAACASAPSENPEMVKERDYEALN